jgi:hypothetical protein
MLVKFNSEIFAKSCVSATVSFGKKCLVKISPKVILNRLFCCEICFYLIVEIKSREPNSVVDGVLVQNGRQVVVRDYSTRLGK